MGQGNHPGPEKPVAGGCIHGDRAGAQDACHLPCTRAPTRWLQSSYQLLTGGPGPEGNGSVNKMGILWQVIPPTSSLEGRWRTHPISLAFLPLHSHCRLSNLPITNDKIPTLSHAAGVQDELARWLLPAFGGGGWKCSIASTRMPHMEI